MAADCVRRSLWLLGLGGDPHIREPPLLWRTGGLWLIEMQGTGWQSTAAIHRQSAAEKGQRVGEGTAGEKSTKGAACPPLPALTLEFRSSNPQPPLTPRPLPSHSPHSNIHTQGLCRCHWLPFPHPRGMNGQTRIKPPQQLPQEVQPLGVGTESPCSV